MMGNRGGWARVGVLVTLVGGEFAYWAMQANGITIGPGVLWSFFVFAVGGWAVWVTKALLKILEVVTLVKGDNGLMDRMHSAETAISDVRRETVADVQEIVSGVEGRLEVEKGRIDRYLDMEARSA